ncbi:hypothetical protein GC163_22325 [bacterium]|nr:hypothetical protein [bacterium]
MAGSPFEIFRRNQRQLMVVLTGLAMFAFVFLDAATMRSGEPPRSLLIVLVALACAGGMWVIGTPRGKGSELAMYGAIVGAVIAFFGLQTVGAPPVVSTSIGSFTRDDFQRTAQRRAFANRFVAMASENARAQFGSTDDESLLQRKILLHEAKERGIAVSDDAVTTYIEKITENKLALPKYKEILGDLGISEGDLYGILKEELTAQLAQAMDLPPAQQSGMAPLETPFDFWQQYEKLQVHQALDVAAIPVEPFVALVPEPNELELQQFFDRYKNQLPDGLGGPGFLQDRKVNIAYLAADFERFEKEVTEPTEEEVAAYYEANKARYQLLDSPPELPDSPTMPDFVEDQAPASALNPANTPDATTPEAPAAPAEETSKSPPAPTLPETPDKPEPATPEKTEPEKSGAEAARRRPLVIQPVSFLQDAATESPAEETKPEEAKPAESAAATEESKEAPKPAEPATADKPAAEEPATEAPKLELPDLPTGPGMKDLVMPPSPGETFKEPQYRLLDDDLKLEIKETILRERAFTAMGVAVDKAYDEMTKLADEYLGLTDPAEQEKMGVSLTEKLQAYAEKSNLIYAETGLKTRMELLSSLDEPIGSASEPNDNPLQSRATTVAERSFENDTLYYPYRADSLLRDKRYSYWKREDVAPRVPTLAEVKDDVTAAWKLAQAKPLAQARAQALADKAKAASQPLSAAMVGETITGKTEADPISVRETPKFTWLSSPRNMPFQFNPMFMPPPQLSFIDGVNQAGNNFMKTVFEELGPGQIGVAPNEPASIFYVVQVKQRDATPSETGDNLGLKALQSQFLNDGRGGFEQGPYFHLGRAALIEQFTDWRKAYEQRYDVVWAESETQATAEE